MKTDLSVTIGKLKLKNPVLVASGTFGYAQEYKAFFNLKELGAIVTKTVTLNPRRGNPPPRTCETPCGMLNSVGLENPGLEVFIREKLPYLKRLGVALIVSITAENDPREFRMLIEELDKHNAVCAFEINISCPNIQAKDRACPEKLISQDADATYNLVKRLRGLTKKTLITKLSPNVTDIVEIGLAAESAGSDAVSLINTISGMSIDIKTRRPKIAMVTGGLSGPAVRPIAVRMVWELYQKIKLPIIGMGGIIDTPSALEFIIAGATAISVGTANFISPSVASEVVSGLKEYLTRNKIKDINQLIGSLQIEE